jgi:hypothetical protein
VRSTASIDCGGPNVINESGVSSLSADLEILGVEARGESKEDKNEDDVEGDTPEETIDRTEDPNRLDQLPSLVCEGIGFR